MAEPDDPDFLQTQPWAGDGDAPAIRASQTPTPPNPNALRGGWQPAAPAELQCSFPQYEIRSVIGRGGMGAVYLGWQKSLDRLVAIKILAPQLEDHNTSFPERFKREAKALARLKHPGIVAVYDAGETPKGLLYFIMEYIEGTDVQRLIQAQGRLQPAQAVGIAASVCEALAYAHEHGIIHRDIKPSNIMIESDGAVKVADFGVAKYIVPEAADLTNTNAAIGTFDFMAPETLRDAARVDHRADLYSVGVMLYVMLTGRFPRGRFELPSRIVPGLDKGIDRILDRALKGDRDARYSSGVEFRADLESVLRRLDAKPPRGPSDTPPTAKKRMLYATMVALVLALAAGLIAYVSHRQPPAAVEIETVTLKSPPAEASLTGAVLLSWSSEKLDATNLSFDVAIQPAGRHPSIKRVGRNSLVPDDIEGSVKWKVRPVWQHSGGAEKYGAWSREQNFSYFANSLRRILATHTLVVGIGEEDGIFIINDEHGLRGIEIELLHEIFSEILREHGVREDLIITSKEEIWGAKFLRLLDTDSAIDVLASGISINDERRKDYAIDFTVPIFEYYQSLITRTDAPGFSQGRLAVERIAAVEKTTNETLARQLLGGATEGRLRLYSNSGAYDVMLDDLVAGKLDGVLMDKPYALQKIANRKKRDASNGVKLTAWDVSPANEPGLTKEKIGFAVRKSDQVLLHEINAKLATVEPKRRTLLEKYIPSWSD